MIFTTAYDAYALKAFEVHAVDYLLNPIRLGWLFEALSHVRTVTPLRLDVLRELKREARTHLSVNERGRIHLIPVAAIAFLKAELKYVTVRTAEREFLLEESLAKLEQEFLGRFMGAAPAAHAKIDHPKPRCCKKFFISTLRLKPA